MVKLAVVSHSIYATEKKRGREERDQLFYEVIKLVSSAYSHVFKKQKKYTD